MPEAVIVDAIRTPIGALGGGLSAVRPDDLAAWCCRRSGSATAWTRRWSKKSTWAAPTRPAKTTATWRAWPLLLAGFPVEVAGVTVNRLCASGLTAVNVAARAIRAGRGRCLYRRRGGEHVARALFAAQGRDRLSRLAT